MSDCLAGGWRFKSRHRTSAETRMWGRRLAAMMALYTGKGVTPEVNLKEHISHIAPQSSNKAAHSGFETQRRRHQKSKTGESVAPQKGLISKTGESVEPQMDMCPTKNFKKQSSHKALPGR